MLRQLRNKKTAKKIWIGLAIIILPAFVLWGSGSLIRNKEESGYAGRIFGKKIPFMEYKEALDASRNQMIIQYGDNLAEIEKKVNLQALAWERLILLAEVKKRRIKTADKEVVDLIRGYPFFQRKGQFDNAIYAQMMQYVFRTQPRLFEEQTRQNIVLSKLYKEITSDVRLAPEEIKDAYRKSNEQISLDYIASLYLDFTKELNPFEGEIRDYFSKNSLNFKQPLSFNLEYISLVAEGELDEATKEKINTLASRLNKNSDLAKIAKDFNLDIKETGLFGQTDAIPGIGWSPQILALASKAKIGDTLPLVYTDKNYYIIRLKDKKDPYIPGYEAIKDKAKESFIREQAQDIAKQKIENCLKKLKEDYRISPKVMNFKKTAQSFGLKFGSTDLFKYSSYIEGIGASDTFWSIAQNLKDEESSDVIYMPSGFYIIKLKSRVPVAEDKFNAEKTEFTEQLLAQKKTEVFYKFVLELKKRAQLY
jgi:parvulin-like peptidyl-prolyl isomerase